MRRLVLRKKRTLLYPSAQRGYLIGRQRFTAALGHSDLRIVRGSALQQQALIRFPREVAGPDLPPCSSMSRPSSWRPPEAMVLDEWQS